MIDIIPTDITADRSTKIMTVVWNDGHVSRYPYGLLRAGCPCAVCRGGHANMHPEPDPAVFDIELPDLPATQLEKVYGVGSYGLGLEWGDGHHEGIFGWNYLRLLCPCETDRNKMK
jgi:DUF971 family protein